LLYLASAASTPPHDPSAKKVSTPSSVADPARLVVDVDVADVVAEGPRRRHDLLEADLDAIANLAVEDGDLGRGRMVASEI
jgi:hypothetical protein